MLILDNRTLEINILMIYIWLEEEQEKQDIKKEKVVKDLIV